MNKAPPGGDPVELLRWRVATAKEAYRLATVEHGGQPDWLFDALSLLGDFLGTGDPLGTRPVQREYDADPRLRAVARALLGVERTITEWCVFWGGPHPDSADEVDVRQDRQDAESLARHIDDPRLAVGVASRTVATAYGPWRVETPGAES